MLLNIGRMGRAGAARRASRKSRAPGQLPRTRCLVEGLENRWLLSFPIPTLPTIPTGAGHLFVVTSAPYNAVGDGVTVNTTALQQAVNDCVAAGGGTVEIPFVANTPNIYLSNQFTITGNNVNLQIDAGVTLEALARGSEKNSFFITAKAVQNIEISGAGTVNGNGATWWPLTDGPDLFVFNTVNNVLVTGITLTQSPHEHLTFQGTSNVGCNNVTINNITINTASTSPQTDGIDPAGTNFLIENCSISDGDDDVAVKALHAVCANITVQNCTIGYGHGISVGGQTNSGLTGMIVTNCTFDGTDYGLRLKAGAPNGGITTNVSYSNIVMTNVIVPINIESYYANGDDNIPSDPTTVSDVPDPTAPTWTNISYTNVVSTWNVNDPTWSDNYYDSLAGQIWGLPAEPINNLSFTNVQLQAEFGMELNFATNVTFDSSSSIRVGDYGAPVVTSEGFDNPFDVNITQAVFLNQDIGSPTVPFETSPSIYFPDSELWVIQGDGAGVGGSSDQFNFTSASAVGDSAISALLLGLPNSLTTDPAQAGVMYRNSLDPADVFAAVVQAPNGNVYFEDRATYGAAVQISSPVSAQLGGDYLRVVRIGSTFIGEYSGDGNIWTPIGSPTTITMSSNALAGLVATSGVNGNLAEAGFENVQLNPVVAPSVVSMTINGGAAQRSMDTLATIVFNEPVDLNNAISLVQRATGGGSPTPISFTLNTPDDGTTWNLTFPLQTGGSLPNGIYDLTVTAADVTSASQQIPMAESDQTFTFHRLFGDSDGNGIVNNADYFAFKKSYGQASGSANYNPLFDYDGNGIVNNADYFQFKKDYGMQLIYSFAGSSNGPDFLI
jgi:polygalacturonase